MGNWVVRRGLGENQFSKIGAEKSAGPIKKKHCDKGLGVDGMVTPQPGKLLRGSRVGKKVG